MAKTLYDKLGVNRNSTAEEIREAFKDKAKEHHPDKGGKGEDMAEINNAYLVLRDPTKRKRYDDTGEENEVPFDRKFTEFVNAIFIKLVDISRDIATTDLIKDFSVQVGLQIAQVNKGKKTLEKKLFKLEKVFVRLGDSKDNRIGLVVQNNIIAMKNQVKLVEEEIKFLDDCSEIINHHSYKVDEKSVNEINYTWGGYTEA